MGVDTTLKGVNYTSVAGVVAGTLSAGSFINASTQFGSKLRVMYDQYVADADYGAGSVVSMGLLPKGAIVLGFYFASEAQGVATTADIEIGGVAATGAEALTDMTSATAQIVPVLETFAGTPLTADSIVSIINAAQDFKDTKTITLAIIYCNVED